MTDQQTITKSRVKRPPTDYTDPEYWNGMVKMSMSKFFVLCMLNCRSMHGYEITKSISSTTSGSCSPTPGSLYPLLRDFEEGGYVTSIEEVVNGRGRKVYSITDKGTQAFQVASKVWMDISLCVKAGAEGKCDFNSC